MDKFLLKTRKDKLPENSKNTSVTVEVQDNIAEDELENFLANLINDNATTATSGTASTSYSGYVYDDGQIFVVAREEVLDSEDVEMSELTENQQFNDNSDTNGEDRYSSDEEVKNMYKKTKSYKQKFRDSWCKKFTWLSSKQGASYCMICEKKIVGGVSHLQRHERCSTHIRKGTLIKSTTSLNNFLDKHTSINKDVQIKTAELKMIMFMAEHNLPLILMDHLPKFIASVAFDSKLFKNIKCARTKATLMLQNFTAECKMQTMTILKKFKFSLIVDETTDISSTKCLAVIARYADPATKKVTDRFIELMEVEQSSASGISQAIVNLLQRYDIPGDNVVGFAADNAAVMMGNVTGVKTQLQQLVNPNLFVIGCVCHSMALCASAAALKLPKQIEDFTRDVYSYFSNSCKRTSSLVQFQEFINLKPKKLLRPSQTRWLSLEAVVLRIIDLWPALILFFNDAVTEDHLQSASTILNALNDQVFKLYFLFLSYILPIVNKLNLEFQSEKPQLFLLYSRVMTLIKSVCKNFMKKSYIDNCVDLKDINPKNINEYLPIENLYLGAKTEMFLQNCIESPLLHSFKLKCLDYYIELICEMKKRFLHFSQNYKNFEILNPKNACSSEQVGIIALLKQFMHLAPSNIESLCSEFREIPNLPNEVKSNLVNLVFEDFWFTITDLKSVAGDVLYPHLSEFILNILCFPHSSAAAERVFSQLNLIKTKCRNKLSTATCNSLLHCKVLLNNNHCFDWNPSCALTKRNEHLNKK